MLGIVKVIGLIAPSFLILPVFVLSRGIRRKVGAKSIKYIGITSSVAGLLLLIFFVGLFISVMGTHQYAYAQGQGTGEAEVRPVKEDPMAKAVSYIAAALAVGLASIGAGVAVGMAASAAMGAIAENPAVLGRTLILVGLAEGIAIYGLIIAILILLT